MRLAELLESERMSVRQPHKPSDMLDSRVSLGSLKSSTFLEVWVEPESA